jgi:hypothetical protein
VPPIIPPNAEKGWEQKLPPINLLLCIEPGEPNGVGFSTAFRLELPAAARRLLEVALKQTLQSLAVA